MTMNTPRIIAVVLGILTTSLILRLSYRDHTLTPDQIAERGWTTHFDEAWALEHHGGIWFGLLLFTILGAYIVGKYDLPYTSLKGLGLLLLALVLTFVATGLYAKAGRVVPEPLAHDGYATGAAWVWMLFSALALWVFALWYLIDTAPMPSTTEVVTVSVLLVLYAWGSNVKFSDKWDWRTSYWKASLAYSVVIGIGTIYRLSKS
jgi:hypothetical protein